MIRSILCAVAIFSLAACQETVRYVPVKVATPPLKTYSRAQMNAAADELAKLPEDDILVKMVGDYGQLRKAIRLRETN